MLRCNCTNKMYLTPYAQGGLLERFISILSRIKINRPAAKQFGRSSSLLKTCCGKWARGVWEDRAKSSLTYTQALPRPFAPCDNTAGSLKYWILILLFCFQANIWESDSHQSIFQKDEAFLQTVPGLWKEVWRCFQCRKCQDQGNGIRGI